MSSNITTTSKDKNDSDDYEALGLRRRKSKRSSSSSGARQSTIKDLLISDRAIARAMLAVKFLVVAEIINEAILSPNYPFMVNSAYAGSFPSVKPFEDGSSGALFLLQMSGQLGQAIGSLFVGHVSDKIGRKPVMLFTSSVAIIGSIGKYFLRHTFWGFIVMNFVAGLSGSVLAVGIAYSSDLLETQFEIEQAIGTLYGIMLLAFAGGGLISSLMGITHGLFMSLWVGIGLNIIAATIAFFCVIEPPKKKRIVKDQSKNNTTLRKSSSASPPMNDNKVIDGKNNDVSNTTATNKDRITAEEKKEKETIASPKVFDWKLVGLILLACLFDQFGSSVIQILVRSYAQDVFLTQFVAARETPIMSTSAFSYLQVCVAIVVIPATMTSASLFARFGTATTAIISNILTAVQIIAMYEVASIVPPSMVTYAIFFAIYYVGYLFTVYSQLSTGPMIARIAPADKRGFAQGLNSFAMKIGSAFAPFLMSIAYDQIGVSTTTWICVGLCVGSALVNVPLSFVKVLGRSPKKKEEGQDLPPDYHDRVLDYEDGDIIASTLRGSWVPHNILASINKKRHEAGDTYLVVPFGSFEDDKKRRLDTIKYYAKEDFKSTLEWIDDARNGKYATKEGREEHMAKYKELSDNTREHEMKKEMGEWFADYMVDAGWHSYARYPMLHKQMIMNAFPRVLDADETDYTADNIEEKLLKSAEIMNRFVKIEEEENAPWVKVLAESAAERY